MSGLSERDDVVAPHEVDRAFALDGFDRGVPSIFVGGELIVPDVAGSLVIDNFERPGLVLFEAVDLDGKWVAVDDDPLALPGSDHVWFVVDHKGLLRRSDLPDYAGR